MRKLYTLLAAAVLFTATTVYAQAPQKMSYQAVIRNNSGVLVTNTQIGMEINIRKGTQAGTIVYTETQTPTTNANGLVSIEIGSGAGFSTIDWGIDNYYIETKTAVAAPLTTYTITGVSQLLSVPYALHAKTAEILTGTIMEIDPVYTGSPAANITASDITNLSNLSGTNTGDQDLSGLTHTNRVALDSVTGTNTGDQDLSGLATTSSVTTALNMKVDKEAGKGLSTNDYTTAEQTKVSNLSGTNTGDQDLSGLATTTALNNKVDKVSGKGLSTNDYTTAEQTKLAGIATGAEVNVNADWNQATTTAADYIKNKPTIPTNTNQLLNGSGFLTSYTETDPKVGANTSNYVSKWNGTSLVSSSIFDNGNVGIGTSNPTEKLGVAGNIYSTGIIKLPNGTSSAPSYSFSEDLSTGIYRSASNAMSFSVNGYQVATLTSTYLGINSDISPAVLSLSRNGVSSNGSIIRINFGAGTSTGGWTSYAHVGAIIINGGTPLSGALYFSTMSSSVVSEKMRIDNNGNVGIGTTLPSTKLDVNGIITTTGGNSTNWNSAYGWGNHALQGYLTSFTETDPTFAAWNKSTGINITASQVSDFQTSITNNTAVSANTAKKTYPIADSIKLAGIEAGAQVNVKPDWNAASGNTAEILNKPTIPAVADGSETKVTAGTNVTVTGIGTTGSPYVVNATGASILTIGQNYQGGKIFWLDATGQHGLIAATADQSTGIQWYNGTNRYTGTTGDGLYAGSMNTAMILATQMADNQTGNFAAKVCADYSVTDGGVTYGDWYLPSKYELNLLYLQKAMVGGFASAWYWSSSEYNNFWAWMQYFVYGTQGNPNKDVTNYVRAIRAF